MNPQHLKQAEIFAFLAVVFLVGVFLLEKQRRETPPILVLSEEEATYRFDSGSSEIPPAFVGALNELKIPELDSLSKRCACDIIEVVGHTDDEAVSLHYSDLDREMVEAFNRGEVETLRPGSNMDLGMMRALAIVQILKASQRRGRYLQQIRYFFPYSAGQMILLDSTLAAQSSQGEDDRARRRIEVRLRRTQK